MTSKSGRARQVAQLEPPAEPRKVRVAVSPRITVSQAERLARWPGMSLVIEDGRPWLVDD